MQYLLSAYGGIQGLENVFLEAISELPEILLVIYEYFLLDLFLNMK